MFHAHIYFSTGNLLLAAKVRENILNALPQLTYTGQLILKPIGPHPMPMFEIHLPANSINLAMATIDGLRNGLSVLIHPVQADELEAHTNGAKWLGKKLILNLDVLTKKDM